MNNYNLAKILELLGRTCRNGIHRNTRWGGLVIFFFPQWHCMLTSPTCANYAVIRANFASPEVEVLRVMQRLMGFGFSCW